METVPLLDTVQLLCQGGNLTISVTFIYTKCSVTYETWAEKTNIRVNFEKMNFGFFFHPYDIGFLHGKYYRDPKSLSGTKSTSNTNMCKVSRHVLSYRILRGVLGHICAHRIFSAAAAEKYGATCFVK